MEVPVPHVVILPYPAQGHIKPLLHLAELLSQLSDFKVTLVNTEHNHSRLLDQIDQSSFSSRFPRLKLLSIPDGLPADHPRSGAAIVDVVFSANTACKPAFKDLIVSISQLENGKWEPPTCIIADEIIASAIEVAEELGSIPFFAYRPCNAANYWVYLHLQQLLEAGEIPVPGADGDMDKQVKLIPGLENILRRRDLPFICRLEPENPMVQLFLTETSKLHRASGFILNTFEELEAPIVSRLRSVFPNLYTVGPLQGLSKSCIDSTSSSNGSLSEQDRTCLSWLDSQTSKSVVFVSFGSMVIVTHDQLMEFWHGLVDSGKPFLWAIRRDLIWGETGTPPQELTVATSERGYIVGWVPQEEVLAHQAIGCFLSHSGWNSTLESIIAGVPMICWPQIADHHVISRCVSEMWKVGLDMKDICHRSTVEKMVRELIDGKREDIKKSLSELSSIVSDCVREGGSSYNSINKLIRDIKSINSAKHSSEGKK